jgi:hypothetical protein
MHELEPRSLAKVPVLQAAQEESPGNAEKVPFKQALQSPILDPPHVERFPGGHTAHWVQRLAPDVIVKVPLVQDWQAVALATPENVPTGHGRQSPVLKPPHVENDPAGQRGQAIQAVAEGVSP